MIVNSSCYLQRNPLQLYNQLRLLCHSRRYRIWICYLQLKCRRDNAVPESYQAEKNAPDYSESICFERYCLRTARSERVTFPSLLTSAAFF